MAKHPKRLPVAQQIRKGLEEAILWARGEIDLKVTVLELPDPPHLLRPDELTSLRLRDGMTQADFARLLNVSAKTVRSWERGTQRPSRAALRLLQIVRANPSSVYQAAGVPRSVMKVGSKSS